jgi:hypothetical protein
LKLKSIALLNEIIRCKERCTSDEAIAGVAHLITSEVRIFAQLLLYFASTAEVAILSLGYSSADTSSCFFLYHEFLTTEY